MRFIDLHTHTTASDGTDSPAELVRKAHELGLAAVAITDHDTIAGVAEAKAEGAKLGITVIGGCEISAKTEYGDVHILGLWIPDQPEPLLRTFAWLNRKRAARNKRIVEKLRSLGVDITMDEVLQEANGATVGRPHMARLLMKKGVVHTMRDAFHTWLGYGGKAYEPRQVLSPHRAVRLLEGIGATVCLAHPFLQGYPQAWLHNLVLDLADKGLSAMEVWHSSHTPPQMKMAMEWADEIGLAPSGGSDYHGENKPNIHLGCGLGNLRIGTSVLDNLLALRRSQGLPC